MGRASTHTLLALDRYARIMGINPAHFNQAAGGVVFPANTCNDVWYQYAWQDADKVSREELAEVIAGVEEELANWIGYYAAPKWMAKEMHEYPRYHRREYYGVGLDGRGQFKSIKANYGKFISMGERAVTLVGTATTLALTLAYSDPDGDGFDELATIVLPTALTDACELKLYFAGHSGEQEWEIRPLKSAIIAGGSVTITADSWMLIDPDLWEAYPTTGGVPAVNLDAAASFVASVEVYREYTDTTTANAVFYWERHPNLIGVCCSACGGAGCAACSLIEQNGCLHVRSIPLGIVVPTPATYDANAGTWSILDWVECREPDQVKIWYYAGDVDNKFLREQSCEPLSNWWAEIISWIVTARLERPMCSCGNLRALYEDLRTDIALSGAGGSYALSQDLIDNPIGTRKGEIKAWKRLRSLTRDIIPGVALG